MSNGLLQGVSEGLRLGLQGFIGERDRRDKRAIQEREMLDKREQIARMIAKEKEDRQIKIGNLIQGGAEIVEGDGRPGLITYDVGGTKLGFDPERDFRKKLQIASARAAAEAGIKGTVGEQEADKDAAKRYSEYEFGGGKAIAQANVDKISGAAVDVGSKKLTGGLLGQIQKVPYVGEGIVRTFSPERISTKQDVDSVVVQSLKDTFGGNPTEGERKALLETIYDPGLPPETIQKRLLDFGTVVAQQKQAKDAAANWFKTHRNMRGYNGPTPISKADFLKQVTAMAESQGKVSGLIPEASATSKEEQESLKRQERIRALKSQVGK